MEGRKCERDGEWEHSPSPLPLTLLCTVSPFTHSLSPSLVHTFPLHPPSRTHFTLHGRGGVSGSGGETVCKYSKGEGGRGREREREGEWRVSGG